jgi:hypothetical protein
MGSAGIAALLAQVAFWCLLLYGLAWDELTARGAVIFVVLWVAGLYLFRVLPPGVDLFPPFVAVLDVVLVLLIFKGDVRFP